MIVVVPFAVACSKSRTGVNLVGDLLGEHLECTIIRVILGQALGRTNDDLAVVIEPIV